MLKFDNTHIFTGYLKQLLSSFNLPACKIYTKEFADYLEKHGKEDPRVIESFDTIIHYNKEAEDKKDDKAGKKRIAYRLNYLKNDGLYHYFWPYSSESSDLGNKNKAWRQHTSIFYDEDKNIPGLTKHLVSNGNIYDTTTHEYLGDYLRFLRDYYGLNLMSLYNCFNNKICNNILHELFRDALEDTKYVRFDSQDTQYRIYAIPVKLFQDYTIAIDSSHGVEMFCGIYNTTLDTSTKSLDLMERTYMKVNRSFFKQPFLYDKLNVKYWGFEYDGKGYPDLINGNVTRWDIAIREQDLKLFIKVPVTCKSSIVILEGDYRNFNDFKYVPKLVTEVVNNNPTTKCVWEFKQNSSVVNFGATKKVAEKDVKIDLNDIAFNPISKLQLFAFNTGESYPFADRLIEYLSGSACTPIDKITDNVKRAQKVMNQNKHYFKIDGLWENKMQQIIYDYLINAGPVVLEKDKDGKVVLTDKRRGYHPALGHVSKSMLFDVLGYVDRDAEKYYASWTTANVNNKLTAVVKDSIQNVDIYNGLFDI